MRVACEAPIPQSAIMTRSVSATHSASSTKAFSPAGAEQTMIRTMWVNGQRNPRRDVAEEFRYRRQHTD